MIKLLISLIMTVGVSLSFGAEQKAPDNYSVAGKLYSVNKLEVVILYAQQGKCPEGLKEASYQFVTINLPPIFGCWLQHGHDVRILFEDGDRMQIPATAFGFGQRM